jgi:large subunit ribosomal protein L10
MDVSSATKLRMDFISNDVDYYIAKNTLTKLAAKNAGYEDIFNSILVGQIGIAYANDDPTAPAKVIKNFTKDNENFEVVGLYFDGALFDPSKYKELASLPSRDELLTKLVCGLNSPMTKVAMSLNSVMAKLAGTLTSLKEQKQ